jgi:dephospho-CoA kinase
LGVEVTDSDVLAHALTAPGGPGHAAVLAAFGPAVRRPDGTLDRSRLRQLVFDDAVARARLEAILHPLIRAAARREIDAWTGPYGLLVVPLLFERGGLSGVDRVLVVDCPEDEQVRRVVARSGLPAAEVHAIMATQLPRADRLARADDILDNAGPPTAIVPQVAELDRRYRALAATGAGNRGAAAQ